jgi:hypothetical protein
MQALQQKALEAKELATKLEKIRQSERTIDQRVQHNKDLQYVHHEDLFIVAYTTVHKAASDNNLLGVKTLLALPKINVVSW